MKHLILILIVSIFTINQAQASVYNIQHLEPPKVAPIKQGQQAPFDGVLFSTEAAAQVYADKDTSDEKCESKIKERTELQKAASDLAIANEKASKESAQALAKTMKEISDEQIKNLSKELERKEKAESKKVPSAAWIAIGVVGGVLITVATGYAIGQIK